jgi:cell division protein FtsW
LLSIGAAMFVVSGARKTHLVIGLIAGVLMIGTLILAEPYRRERLAVFLNPSADTLDSGYHINQSLLAIGSGGLWGKGFGQSVQKYLYLPEPHTDSIFAIIVEELGFVRSILLVIVIGLFAYRGYSIAIRAGDVFSRMVAFGITTWFSVQALINVAAILGLVPLTGIPLPFISYGGTAVLVGLVAVGVMTNISRHSYGN